MKTLLLSSLNKVFKDTEPSFDEFEEYSALKNENFSFQLAFKAESNEETEIHVSVSSDIQNCLKLYYVKDIPSGLSGYPESDSFHYDLSRKQFPDLLVPIEDKIKVKKGTWNSIWVEVTADDKKAGTQLITVALEAGGKKTERTFTLNVIDCALPKQTLLYTNWFHNDCLCTYYGVEPFSERYWEIVDRYIKNAVYHGVNMLLTPVFTPPLDTEVGGERPTIQLVKVTKEMGGKYSFNFDNFEKYVSLCLKNGIQAFEISHLFTQWGATSAPKIVATVNGKEEKLFGWETKASGKKYVDFLEAFAKEFNKEVKKLGIKKRCWIHVSDEPNEKQLDSYKKAADTIHRLFPGYNNFDALSDIRYYKNGLVKTPVCSVGHADEFRKEVKNFWTYHCCGQTKDFLPNRMFAEPSQRNRILGILLYKYKAQGFLQWGHNFWYSQYSRFPIDPFKITDANGAFPSGDSYVVYPGKDGTPLNSLRHKVFLDAMQDLRALNLLEEKRGRKFTLTLIEKGLDIPLSFKTYPHEAQWLLDTRSRINEAISNS